MTDVFSKQKRSEIMSKIRGGGNKSTEIRLISMLEKEGIVGWRTNAKDVFGKPDLVFDNELIAIFVDGCFWHGCIECRSIPASNTEFWVMKLQKTKDRDALVNVTLSENGWIVLRFWEHELKKTPEMCLYKILDLLKGSA